ncbi:MAG TPA: tetratricopeptide repeat protein [Longimicrobiaceae bacterium]
MGQTDNKRAPRLRSLPPIPGWLPEYKLVQEAEAIGDVVGLTLLRVLRDLRLWVDSTPEERLRILLPPSHHRAESVEYASEHSPAIAESLRDLSAMRSDPDRATAEVLKAACQRIARWAHRNSLSSIALLYSEAAVRVAPLIAANANYAGRMARIAGYAERAELWYDYGIGIAGRDGNRNRGEMIRALLGKGLVLREQGRLDDAKHFLDRAARLCAATRRHRLAAETHHDLYTLDVMLGAYAEAETHMLRALQHYPIHHAAIPGLIHDWCFLLVQQGYYAQAVPLLRASIPTVKRVEIQLVSWGTLSRAAAGAGFRDLYEEAVEHMNVLVERTLAYASAALIQAANGTRSFEEWEVALSLAMRARAIAEARGETEVLQEVEEVTRSILARESALQIQQPPRDSRISEIDDRLISVLKARERPVRRPVQSSQEREASGQLVPARRVPSSDC